MGGFGYLIAFGVKDSTTPLWLVAMGIETSRLVFNSPGLVGMLSY